MSLMEVLSNRIQMMSTNLMKLSVHILSSFSSTKLDLIKHG